MNQLAAEMAAALANTFPRARISQLEPVHAVARGVLALIEERLKELKNRLAAKTHLLEPLPLTFLDVEELRIEVLAECLATWQDSGLEPMIDRWLSESPLRRDVSFMHGYCPPSGPHRRIGCDSIVECTLAGPSERGRLTWHGDGPTPAIAFGEALKNFDETDEE